MRCWHHSKHQSASITTRIILLPLSLRTPPCPLPLFPQSALHFYDDFFSYQGTTRCGTFWNLLLLSLSHAVDILWFVQPSVISRSLCYFQSGAFIKQASINIPMKHFEFFVCLTEIPEAQGLGCLVVGHLVFLRNCFILCHFIRDSLLCLLLLLWYILAEIRRHCWLTVDFVFILVMNSDIEYLLVYSFVKCLFIFYPCFHWIVFYVSGFESIRY